MSNDKIIERLFSSIKENNKPAYFTSGKEELTVRCPYCGDSVKDKSHCHLYIKVEPPFLFFCQRCESSGVVNDGFLEDMNIDNDSLSRDVFAVSRQYQRNTTLKSKRSINAKALKFPKYTSEFNWKKEYIEERLDSDVTKADLLQYKVISNFEDFLVLNELESMLDDNIFYKQCKTLDKYSLGWVSRDATHITFRYIKGNFNYRFKTVKISDNPEASKTYVLGSKVDRMAKDVELVISEGFFDIVSVYRNFYKKKDNLNRIFCAVNGKGFNQFPHFLQRNYGYLNLNLKIYADNDQNVCHYKNLLQMHRYDSIQIYHNVFEKEKDFGVPLDRIKVKIHKLK